MGSPEIYLFFIMAGDYSHKKTNDGDSILKSSILSLMDKIVTNQNGSTDITNECLTIKNIEQYNNNNNYRPPIINAMQDSQEFFLNLVKAIKLVSPAEDGSTIIDMLLTHDIFEAVCSLYTYSDSAGPIKCNNITKEYFHVLNLFPLTNFQELLHANFSTIRYLNTNNGGEIQFANTYLDHPTKCLIFFIASYGYNGTQAVKLTDIIDFKTALSINIQNICLEGNMYVYDYKLNALLLHHGGIDAGHYIAMRSSGGGKWKIYNDSSISELTEFKIPDSYTVAGLLYLLDIPITENNK